MHLSGIVIVQNVQNASTVRVVLDTSTPSVQVAKDLQVLACANAAHSTDDCTYPENASVYVDESQYAAPGQIK